MLYNQITRTYISNINCNLLEIYVQTIEYAARTNDIRSLIFTRIQEKHNKITDL